MRRAGVFILLVLLWGVAAADDTAGYRVEVIGGGVLALTQPRCLRTAPSGRVYFLHGEKEWVYGGVFDADGSHFRRFGGSTRTGTREDLWYHPASLRPTASGDLLVADTGRRRVLRFDADGTFKAVVVGAGGGAGALEGPTDVLELPSRDLVVCDSASSRVLLYDAAGTFKRVIASSGSKPHQVSHPFSLALDANGDLWVVDTVNRRLVERGRDLAVKRVLSPTDDDGPLLGRPSYVDFDRRGNLLVADDARGGVLVLSPSGRLLRRIGLVEGEPRPFAGVSGVTVTSGGTVLAADVRRNAVFRFDADGRYLDRLGMANYGENRVRTVGAGVLADGRFFDVLERPQMLVRVFGRDGVLQTEFGGEGTVSGKFLRPRSAAAGPDGNIYVADSQRHDVTVYRGDGVLVRVFGRAGHGPHDVLYPRTLAVGDDGLVYVGDAGNRRVQLFEPDGTFLRTFARDVNPYHIDVDAGGNCAVYDDAEQVVVVFDRSGKETWRAEVRDVGYVGGVAFTSDGTLWVLDAGRGLVIAFGADGKRTELARDATYRRAQHLVRGRDGRMYAVGFGVSPLSPDGTAGRFVRTTFPAAAGQVVRPSSLALVSRDALAVLGEMTGTVQIFGRDGTFRRVLETPPDVTAVTGIATTPEDDLALLDSPAGKLYAVGPDGKHRLLASGEALRDAWTFDIARDGKIYVLSGRRRGVVQLDAALKELGVIEAESGRRRFHWPRALCAAPEGGVLVADWRGGNVHCYGADLGTRWILDQETLPAELRTTGGVQALRMDGRGNLFLLCVEPDCIRIFAPDRSHLATLELAKTPHGALRAPRDLRVDTTGCIYVADTGNNRVLKLIPER